MEGYSVGDRVQAIVNHPDNNSSILAEDTGTVCNISAVSSIGVEWDKPVSGGHSCDHTCEDGFGWYVDKDEIALCGKDDVEDIDEDSFLQITCSQL